MNKINISIKSIKINNLARFVGVQNDQDWYEWMVFIDEGEELLQQIESVEYLLHRTFPNPLRRATDSGNHFALKSGGWGEFNIFITVFLTNGERYETTYRLDLGKPWDTSPFNGSQ